MVIERVLEKPIFQFSSDRISEKQSFKNCLIRRPKQVEGLLVAPIFERIFFLNSVFGEQRLMTESFSLITGRRPSSMTDMDCVRVTAQIDLS